jgi:hypothetical protein
MSRLCESESIRIAVGEVAAWIVPIVLRSDSGGVSLVSNALWRDGFSPQSVPRSSQGSSRYSSSPPHDRPAMKSIVSGAPGASHEGRS